MTVESTSSTSDVGASEARPVADDTSGSGDVDRRTPVVQIAIDCTDPHRLVRFWAETMGMTVEDHHDQILGIVEAGYASLDDDTTEIDGRRAWKTAAACYDPSGRLPRLLFQVVPEPKTAKDRIHLDVHFGADRRDAEVERIKALGATYLWEASQGPHSWVTLADPEGNEFCVA